jgi:DNA repair protein RecO (recombination protein O)
VIEARVVGGVDLGEADRVVRLLSADQGRWSAVARGARASRRRFAGALEIGTRLHVVVRRGRGDLPVLAEAERLSGPVRAREDWDRLLLLGYGTELVASLAPEAAEAAKLYGLYGAFVDQLEGDRLPVGLRTALECKALVFAGLGAVLDRCARCGGPPEGGMRFWAEAGGAVHGPCGSGTPVSIADLRAWSTDLHRPMAEAAAVSEEPWLLARFAEHQLGRRLRSLELLAGGGLSSSAIEGSVRNG